MGALCGWTKLLGGQPSALTPNCQSERLGMSSFYSEYFYKIYHACGAVDESFLDAVVTKVRAVKLADSKIIIAGNGGSAALASHVAVDFTKAAGVRAINFNEADLITCFSNDFGYENWLAEAVGFYAQKDDLLVLVSSSGQSENMLRAAEKGIKMGLTVVTLSGFSPENPLRNLGHLNAWCASDHYNVVEMTHHIWLLAIVDKYILLRK